MKKILFIVGTHGDEQAGLNLFHRYPYGRKWDVEWKVIVGNPQAVTLNTRYTEVDLNRCGNVETPTTYEEVRALELIERMKDFDVVYDIHQTQGFGSMDLPDCIFVNSIHDSVMRELQFVKAPHIIWDSNPVLNKTYLTSNHPKGICLEYQKTLSAVYDQVKIVNDFLQIIEQTNTDTKKILWEANIPVTQFEAEKYHLNFTNFKELTEAEKLLFDRLNPNCTYAPVFVNTKDIDPEYYCFLNKKIKEL